MKPKPEHFLQAPIGLLNENNLGLNSLILKPEIGQIAFFEKIFSFLS